jgi:uncharacterized protein YukE
MPNWQPNWNNVRWDWGAADAAAAALRRAADLLNGTASERARVAAEAQAQWRGLHRDRFDSELAQVLRRAQDLADEYREAANRIARASQRAWDEQRHRERERERWRREKEDEERRQREEDERRRRV